MTNRSLAQLRRGRLDLGPGPVAVVFAEDLVLIDETLSHLAARGFATTMLLRDPAHAVPDRDGVIQVDHPVPTRAEVAAALTALNRLLDGHWLFWCFNAEFLIFPWCETRPIGDLTSFMQEERRASVHCCTVDLYATDLDRYPDGVCREAACFDSAGYYSYQSYADGQPLDRQVEIFGGLAWRFEEHIPWTRRHLDRRALYRARGGLTMNTGFRLSDPEMNTISCQWHRNVTASILSFRVAKALRRNPDSAAAITGFHWAHATPCDWSSRQMMEAGFMEPGQWF